MVEEVRVAERLLPENDDIGTLGSDISSISDFSFTSLERELLQNTL